MAETVGHTSEIKQATFDQMSASERLAVIRERVQGDGLAMFRLAIEMTAASNQSDVTEDRIDG